MRLGDLDALKKHTFTVQIRNGVAVEEIEVVSVASIDNATTIPLPDFKEGYKQAIIDGKTNFSRPQGEWIKIDEEWYDYKCSICGEKVRQLYPFCHCGADMRKGGTE